MKWIKKVFIVILSLIIINCIFFLAISFNLKNILINGVIKETIIENIVPRSYNDENNVITEEQIKEITSDPRVQELLNSPEIQELLEKYLDTTVDGLLDEESIDEVALEEDMARFIKENRSIIEEKVGKEITDDMIDKAMEQVESKDISNAYKQSIANASRNMTKTEKSVLKGYKYLISWNFRIIMFIVIAVSLLLIALIQKSFYKWIGTFSKSLIVSGIGIVLASIITNLIVNSQNLIDKFNTNSLTITGIIILVSGILILIIYKLLTRKKDDVDEISQVSKKE